MGYVGARFVVNQANTTDGGAINTVAYASTGASAGQYVGGAYAVNLYTGPFGTLSLDFINNYYAIVGVSKTFSQVITFSRASNATRFAPDGTLQYAPHNLLLYSEQFDNAAWTKTNSTITANTVIAPDGALTGDKLVENTATAAHFTLQTVSLTNGTAFTASVYVKAGERTFTRIRLGDSGFIFSAVVNLTTGLVDSTSGTGSVVVTPVGNNWYRIACTGTVVAGNIASLGVYLRIDASTESYTGNGYSGIFVWGAQLAVGPYPLDYTPTTTAVVYGPRFDYNPTTLAPRGLLMEEQRTNSIRNNTMVGAVAGTPGTLPTNWSLFASNGLTTSVSSTGVSNGINYIDLRISGTSTGTFYVLAFDTTAASASAGQVWTESFWAAIVGGSTSNITTLGVNLRQVGGAANNFDAAFTPTSILTRYTSTGTLTTSATGVFAALALGFASGVAIDITLRIGLPQLELGAFATSVIPTATAAVTRSADIASINTLSPWYNAAEGTLYGEGSVANPASGSNQFFFRLSDNSYNNSIALNVQVSGFASLSTAAAGVFDGIVTSLSALSANTTAKFDGAYATNNLGLSLNGATTVTDATATIPTALTRADIGSDHIGLNRIKAGYLRRISYYNRRLTNAELQVLTS